MSLSEILKKMKWKVKGHLQSTFSRGVEAAASYAADRVKEELSVPADLKNFIAEPGKPPKMRTGDLRESITYQVLGDFSFKIMAPVRSAKGFPYGIYHDIYYPQHPLSGRFPFRDPTIEKYKKVIVKIIRRGRR